MVRVVHARVTFDLASPVDHIFNAFSRWAGYEQWAPQLQGPAHWLVIRAGGPGSQFILYDKFGPCHLVHFGTVTETDRRSALQLACTVQRMESRLYRHGH